MRTITKFLAMFLLLVGSAMAQNFTTVSGSVTDPNGLPYAYGSITFQLVNTSGVPQFASQPVLPTTPVTPVSASIGPVGLDTSGSFTVSLPSNAVISPAGTKWLPTVCSAQGTVVWPKCFAKIR